MITKERINVSTIAVTHNFLKGHLSETSVIDSKYIEMTGLQGFYEAVSFTDPFQKQPQEVLCKKDVLKNLRNFRGKHLCFPMKFCKLLRTSANDCFYPF